MKRRGELAWHGRWFHSDQTVLRRLRDFRACGSEKLCHLRDFVTQSLGYARGGVQRDESARRSVHSESLRCRLCGKKTSAAVHDLVGDRRFPFDSR